MGRSRTAESTSHAALVEAEPIILLSGADGEPPPAGRAFLPSGSVADSLRHTIFGDEHAVSLLVRDAVVGLGDIPQSGLTYAQEADKSLALLRRIIVELGGSACEIAADTQLRGALCDWAAIAAPRLLPVLTGHFDLAIGAILRLGNGSDYQQELLAELDTGAALGALLLTELGGTNGPDQQTLAEWDDAIGCFRLSTPSAAAAKFMPNVATGPRTVVVTARTMIHGQDEGVLPFLFRLRDENGLAAGVHIAALPDKAWAPMDHAAIRFDNTVVSRDALLGGEWAQIDTDGNLDCELGKRQRFHRAIGALQSGRVDLANASVASARAGLAALSNYARQRLPAGGILMAERDAVQRALVSGLANIYAMSALGAEVRDRLADDDDPGRIGVWAMLTKPLLTTTAHSVLMTCRHRAAAQGALRTNYLVDWIGNLEGALTAEGETEVLQVAAGRLPRQVALGSAHPALDISRLRVRDTPAEVPWWSQLLSNRESALALAAKENRFDGIGALGPDSGAVEMATATAERLAVDALTTAAHRSTDPAARALLTDLAAVYALERIEARARWYTANGQMTPATATEVDDELTRRRRALVDHIPELVAAFDIPYLPAPILSSDYLAAWQHYIGWDDAFPSEPAPELNERLRR
ncbi:MULTISPECIES: acyl-CoA dehydrogenase family protein [unclassified Nocardia]|uniref:acyl-CoA dehydrogenase family protein n=1 Tax=unclassified Nocardia TaxID=2637762 RepID=UPI001CE4A171|nr:MULTISPECIES: acyl-CoA dehydrogenase family protein [unclassified Nocardia]